jgi:hypothetical protein
MTEYPCQLHNCIHCKPIDTEKMAGYPFCYLCSEFVGFSLFKMKSDEKPPHDFNASAAPLVVIDPDAELSAENMGEGAISNDNFMDVSAMNIGKPRVDKSPACRFCGHIAKSYAGRRMHERIVHGYKDT